MVDIKIYGRYSVDEGETYLSELIWSKEMQYNNRSMYDTLTFEQSLNSFGKLDISLREYSPMFLNFIDEKYKYVEIFFDDKLFWRGTQYELSISADYEGGKRLIQKIDVSYQGLLCLLEQHNVMSVSSEEDAGASDGDNISNCFRNIIYWNEIFDEFNSTIDSSLEKIFFDSMEILVDNSSDESLKLFHLPIDYENGQYSLVFIDSLKSIENWKNKSSYSSTVTTTISSGTVSGYSSEDGYQQSRSYQYSQQVTNTTQCNYYSSVPEIDQKIVDTSFNGFLSSGNNLSILQNISDFCELFGGNLYQSIESNQLHLKVIEEEFLPIQDANINSDSVISFKKVKNIERIYSKMNVYALERKNSNSLVNFSIDSSPAGSAWTRRIKIGTDDNGNPIYTGYGYLQSATNSHRQNYYNMHLQKNLVKSLAHWENPDVTISFEKNIYFPFFNNYNQYKVTYILSDEQRQHVTDLYATWDLNHRYTIKIEAFDKGFIEDRPIIDMNKRIPVTLPEIGLDKVPGLVTSVAYDFLAPENNRVTIEIGTKDASFLYSPQTIARIMNAKEGSNG